MTNSTRYLLAGLETGVSGALAMLGWLLLPSLWTRRAVWWIPNLFASMLGTERLGFRLTEHTATGLALELFLYGTFGCLFGLLWRDGRGGLRLLWMGLIFSLATWYIVFRLGWRHANTLGNAYSPDRQFLLGSLVYGLMLARYPGVARRVGERA